MNKKEAIELIRSKKGYVPYIALFEIYSDTDQIPDELIELECKPDKYEYSIICSPALADALKELQL